MIDIGLNLTNAQFNPDRDDVMARARAAGIQGCLLTGVSLESSLASLRLAQHADDLRATAGVHPHAAKTWTAETRRRLAACLDHAKVIAVGECGLDYDRMASSVTEQRIALSAQLDLAAERGKPLFLHLRAATDDTDGVAMRDFFDLIRPRLADGITGVVHCFTGNRAMLDACLDAGFFIGITGWACDDRRGQLLQALLPLIPDDRLMLETDAPYLLPRTMPGARRLRRNEPAFLPYIADTVARLRGQTVDHVAHVTTANVRRCFGWTPTADA